MRSRIGRAVRRARGREASFRPWRLKRESGNAARRRSPQGMATSAISRSASWVLPRDGIAIDRVEPMAGHARQHGLHVFGDDFLAVVHESPGAGRIEQEQPRPRAEAVDEIGRLPRVGHQRLQVVQQCRRGEDLAHGSSARPSVRPSQGRARGRKSCRGALGLRAACVPRRHPG